jgi:hypothetical protein
MTATNIGTPRALRYIQVLAACMTSALVLGGCATEGTSAGGFYGLGYYHDDPWYWGGCCVEAPDVIGPPPPRPEHPIAGPPPGRPEHPIATPPPRPTPMPRPAARGGRR